MSWENFKTEFKDLAEFFGRKPTDAMQDAFWEELSSFEPDLLKAAFKSYKGDNSVFPTISKIKQIIVEVRRATGNHNQFKPVPCVDCDNCGAIKAKREGTSYSAIFRCWCPNATQISEKWVRNWPRYQDTANFDGERWTREYLLPRDIVIKRRTEQSSSKPSAIQVNQVIIRIGKEMPQVA